MSNWTRLKLLNNHNRFILASTRSYIPFSNFQHALGLCQQDVHKEEQWLALDSLSEFYLLEDPSIYQR